MRAAAAFFLSMALTSLPALALPQIELELGPGGTWVRDDGFGLVSTTTALGRVDLGARWHPGWRNDTLVLRLGYAYGSTERTAFGSMSTSFAAHTIDASLAWTFLSGTFGSAWVRGGPVVDVQNLAIHEGTSAQSGTALSMGLGAAAGGALWFGGPDSELRHLGLFLEGGWAQRFYSGDFSLTRDVDGNPDPAPIAGTPVTVGSLSLSGAFLHGGLVVRL